MTDLDNTDQLNFGLGANAPFKQIACVNVSHTRITDILIRLPACVISNLDHMHVDAPALVVLRCRNTM